MNVRHLTATNLRTLERIDLTIPHGVTALVGPNGSGKSSLLNAIDVALFAERGELPPLRTRREDDLEITLTFDHDFELYRVRRQLRASKAPTVDFERNHLRDHDDELGLRGDSWIPLTQANANATQEVICDTIGLTRQTFRASSFLRQGDAAAFTEASPRDRKTILGEIVTLDEWQRLLDQTRLRLRARTDALAAAVANVERREAQIAEKGQAEQTWKDAMTAVGAAERDLAAVESQLERAIEAKAENAVKVERVTACRAELAAAEAEQVRVDGDLAAAAAASQQLAGLRAELTDADAAAVHIDRLDAELVAMRELDSRVQALIRERDTARSLARDLAEDVRRIEAERAQREQAAATLREKADTLAGEPADDDRCDRCQQHLGVEARQAAISSYRAEADTITAQLRDELAGLRELKARQAAADEKADSITVTEVVDVEPAIQRLAHARQAAVLAATLAERVAAAAAKAETLSALTVDAARARNLVEEKRAALISASDGVADLSQLDAAITTARTRLALLKETAAAATRAMSTAEIRFQEIKAAEQELDEHRAAAAAIRDEVEMLKLAERLYGPNGAPALLVEAIAVPQIESEANRLLALMPTSDGVTFQVRLETQKQLKGSEEIRETLDIVISDGLDEGAYETYSGGEKARINLCLRIALARLLANRRGTGSRLLCVDELEYLDQQGQEQLVQVVEAIRDSFDTILVVSHSPNVRDSFDQVIELEKTNGRSRIVASAEAVAA